MKFLAKLYWIAVFGTIWGTIELFGGDLMRVYNLPHKAAILSALGIGILLVSKRFVPHLGSAVAVGVIACLYKLTSNGFYSCQLLAVMIHALTFDLAYFWLHEKIERSARARALAAIGITAVSFTVFGFVNTYVIPEPHWAERGLNGIAEYLRGSGVIGALLGIIIMEFAHRLAGRFASAVPQELIIARPLPIGVLGAVVIACWAAGVAFALS